jgi:hypothetical protein
MAGRQQRVVGGHAHAEVARHAAGDPGDGAVAHEAEALACELAAHEFGPRPFAGGDARRGEPRAAQQQQRGGDDVLRHRQVVGTGGWIDRDAARLAGRHVDVVEADAQAPHDLEQWGGVEQRATHLRAVADDQRARVAQGCREPRRVVHELRVVQHVAPGEGGADGCLVHEFRDDDL